MRSARPRPHRARSLRAAVGALLAVLVWIAGGAVHAREGCVALEGGGSLTIAGVGRVVFEELATDRASDRAVFGGGVCVSAADGAIVVRTERLLVRGLAGELALEASAVVVEVPGWTLRAAGLAGGADELVLSDVAIVGQDAIGLAERMALDLATGDVAAVALRLVTPSTRLDARQARLAGGVLWADDARLSSCDCPPDEAPIRLEAVTGRFDLASESLTLVGGALVALGGRWPLPEPVEVGPTTLADLRLPLAVGPDPERPGAWRLRWTPDPGVERVEAAWGVSGGAGAALRWTADGRAREGAVEGRWTLASDGLDVAVDGRGALASGWRWTAGQRVQMGAVADDPVRDTWLRVARPFTFAVAGVDGSVGARAALTGQTLDGRDVAGPRLGVDARATWSAEGEAVDLAWTVAAGASAYPSQARAQAWVSLRPAAAVRVGGLRVDVAHEARWVAGASPFGATVDRVEPLHRTDATFAWRDGEAAYAALAVRYRWDADTERPGQPVGVDALTVSVGAGRPWAGGRAQVDVEVELAGVVDPRPDRDAFGRATLAWRDARWELGLRGTLGLRPGDGWREVTVFAAVPIDATPAWALTPYLAVDLLGVAGGAGPWLRGHGLELAWEGCCGRVELGYRSDVGGATTTHVAIVLPVRELDPARLAAAR